MQDPACRLTPCHSPTQQGWHPGLYCIRPLLPFWALACTLHMKGGLGHLLAGWTSKERTANCKAAGTFCINPLFPCRKWTLQQGSSVLNETGGSCPAFPFTYYEVRAGTHDSSWHQLMCAQSAPSFTSLCFVNLLILSTRDYKLGARDLHAINCQSPCDFRGAKKIYLSPSKLVYSSYLQRLVRSGWWK